MVETISERIVGESSVMRIFFATLDTPFVVLLFIAVDPQAPLENGLFHGQPRL